MKVHFGRYAAALIVLACAGVFASAADAQLIRQLGTLGTGNSFPFNGTSFRWQTGYAPADLNMPPNSSITEIRVFGSAGGNSTYTNLRCRIAHSQAVVNALSTTFDLNWIAASVVTCLGPTNYVAPEIPAAGGSWYRFVLTTPFVYNGTDNLIVDWSYDARAGTGFTISTAVPPAPEQPRSRLYSSGGNWQTVTGTSAASQGNYGIQYLYLPPGNAVIMQNTPAVESIGQAGADFPVMKLRALAFNANQTLNSITFSKTGTMANVAIAQVKLVRDNNDNGIVEGTDTTLGTGTLNVSSQITFSGAPLQSVTTAAGVPLLLAITYTGPQAYGTTVNFAVTANTDIAWSGGTDYSDYPMNSGLKTVEPAVIEMGTTLYNNTVPFGQVSLRAHYAYTAAELGIPAGGQITEIRIGGTVVSPTPMFAGFRLRLGYTAQAVASLTSPFDLNIIGGAAGLTTVLGPVDITPEVVPNAGGQWYVFRFTTPFTYTAANNLLLDFSWDGRVGQAGFNVNTGAKAGEQLRNRVYSTTATAGGMAAVATGTIATLGNLGIKFYYVAAPAGITAASAISPVVPGLAAAGLDRVVSDLRVTATGANRDITSLKFTRQGTVTDSQISQVRLMRDNNNDGVVNAGDTQLGAGTLTAGAITFSGAPLLSVTTAAPVRLLVAINNLSALNFGDTLDLRVETQADMVVAGGGGQYSWFPLSSGMRVIEPPSATTGNIVVPNSTSIGFGTTSGWRRQTAYTAASLGIPAGALITEIRVHGSIISPVPQFNGMRIGLAYTNLTPATLTSTFANNFTAPLQTCFGPADITPELIPFGNAYFYRFPLTTPFVYNGTSTLLVDFLHDSHIGTGFNVASGTIPVTFPAQEQRAVVYTSTAPPSAQTTGTLSTTAGTMGIRFMYLDGPVLMSTSFAGTATTAPATTTGPGGNGQFAGRFTVTSSPTAGAILTGIRLGALGTANDATAYTEVAIYRDLNANNLFDFGFDPLVAATAPNFGTDDGEITFNVAGPEQLFNTNETRTYLIVVKLNGPTLALHNQTLNFNVRGLLVGVGSYGITSPTPTILGLVIQGPQLVVGALAAPAQPVLATDQGPGNNGRVAGTFTLSNNANGSGDLLSITISALGTGNDQSAFSEVAVYRETGGTPNAWDFGVDTPYGTAATAFPANDGSLTFTQTLSFSASQFAAFYIVVKLNGAVLAIDQDTFNFRVSDLACGPGMGFTGTPSTTMTGLVINGPRLTVTTVAGVATTTLANNTGGGVGILGGMFTITNTSAATSQLTSISLAASGTGDDATAYTMVQLWRDVNDNSTFEPATDIQYAGNFTNFGANDGTRVYTANFTFALSQAVRFLVVVRFNGSPLAVNAQTFNYAVADIGTGPGVAKTNSAAVMNGFVINGPVITSGVVAGTATAALATATGTGNNGINANTFTLSNNNVGTVANVTSVTLTHAGTGNGQSSYTSVRLIEDTNNNSTWDLVGDNPVGVDAISFNVSNQATFTLNVGQGTFDATTAAVTKRYFIVVKLNGTTVAPVGATFNYTLSAAVFSGNTITTTIPNATVMLGLVVSAPTYDIADVPRAQVTAYRTLGDYVLQQFTVGYVAGPANSIASITIGSSGSGNDATGYNSVRLFLDNPTSGTVGDYDAGDALLGTSPAFSGDNSTTVFNLSGAASNFSAGTNKTFFVVGEFNDTPLHNSTFQTRVQAAAAGYTGTTFTPVLPMAGYSAGAVVVLPPFLFTDNSGQVITNAFMGDTGFTLQKFTVEYAAGPNNELGTVTAVASGTGNDLNDYSALHLVLDDPFGADPGNFDGADTVVDTQAAFNADNGTVTFNLAGAPAMFAATDIKQFFVIGDFNQSGINATTFSSTVTGASSPALFGSPFNGLPIGPTAGLNLLDANLRGTFNGPGIATTVNSDSQGVNNEGLMLYDVTLETGPGSGWQILALTFVGTGTADHSTAYSDLWLYQDDGNGTWDGPNIDSPAAAPVAGFAAGTFEATFDLLNVATGLNASRRFFLLGRLAGTAVSGQTLNARLDSVTGTPNVGGSVQGMPLVNSTAMIIEDTALTVLAGPGNPSDLLRKAGTAFVYTAMNLRLGASNDDIDVSSILFSNAGTGSDFAADLSAGDGFQVWLDDGDGVFSAADAILYQGSGAATVNATFSPAITVPNSSVVDLWVIYSVLSTAGAGAAVPDSYQTVVNNPATDVVATATSVLGGTPAPASNVLRLVDFAVTNFDPVADVPTGGRDITITGSGFMAPFIVMIDGVQCPGTPVIAGGGTQVTGIQVPPGDGLDVEISIKSGGLDLEVLTQTFDYIPLATPKVNGDSGCNAGAGGPATWVIGAAMLPVVAALRRRRKA